MMNLVKNYLLSLKVFFLFFPFFVLAEEEWPEWSLEGTQKSIQVSQTVTALKKQANCNPSSSMASILKINNTVERADQGRKQNFICAVNKNVEEQNKKVEEDRQFMLSYISSQSKNPSSLSKEDHIRMTAILMEYRLLRDKKWKEYYFPSTRYLSPKEMQRVIRQSAQSYVKENGPPSFCFFVQEDKDGEFRVKKAKLASKKCKSQIIQKAQPIPSPLILTQAAFESKWGLSDLAIEESNILGLQVKFGKPSTMPEYPNCRPAKKDIERCLLKFAGYHGSINEYFARFNASYLPDYIKYRKDRFKYYAKTKNDSECKKSVTLSNSIGFYAEDKRYVSKVKKGIGQVCDLLKACRGGSPMDVAFLDEFYDLLTGGAEKSPELPSQIHF